MVKNRNFFVSFIEKRSKPAPAYIVTISSGPLGLFFRGWPLRETFHMEFIVIFKGLKHDFSNSTF
jgi:hypothetical protein